MSIDRRFIDVNLSVKSIANEPAASNAAGTQYIVGSNPIGEFAAASANDLARYDGTSWKFTRPSTAQLEVLNLDTGEVLSWDGTAWTAIARFGDEKPVLAVVATGTTLPATAASGDKFLKTDDGKLYTATAEDTWDEGTETSEGDRYASSTDAKVYTSDGSEATGVTLDDGTMFLCKADGCVYVYNATGSALVKFSTAKDYVTETHTLTSSEATAKSFTLSNAVATGLESSVLLSVCGVAQVAGVDFSVSGSTLSWNGKGLENIGLAEGDVFIIAYQAA